MDEELVEQVRREAAAEVEEQPIRQSQRAVDRVLGDTTLPSLEPAKKHLRKSKKKMRTCSYYLCDKCNEPIIKPEDGYIFHGNVYVADPSVRGGLIGNNFPVVLPGTPIGVEDVEETVLCHRCVFEVLGLSKHYAPTEPRKPRKPSQEEVARAVYGPNGPNVTELATALQSVGTGRNGYGESGWRSAARRREARSTERWGGHPPSGPTMPVDNPPPQYEP